MSRQAAEGDMTGMKDSLSFGLRLTLFITIPAMVGLLICATPIFSLIFMGGAFDYSQAVNSARALFYYSLGLTFVAMTRVLAPAFYALKDTKTPVWCALVAFVMNLGFSLWLMGPLKHGGLALATTISACGNMLLLLWFLRRKIGAFGGTKIVRCGLKSIAATLPMALIVQYLISQYDWSQIGHTFTKSAVLGAAVGAGILVYALCVRLLRSDEAMDTITMIRKKLGR